MWNWHVYEQFVYTVIAYVSWMYNNNMLFTIASYEYDLLAGYYIIII